MPSAHREYISAFGRWPLVCGQTGGLIYNVWVESGSHMADGNGATPLDPWLNLGPGDIAITEDSDGGDDVAIDIRDDGSIHIDVGDAVSNSIRASKAHDANLAEFIDNSELRLICDDLLNGIDA